MAFFPQSATGLNYATYPVGPTAAGVTLTASGSTNTKGSYADIIASSGFACTMTQTQILLTTSTNGLQFLLDVATGAGGAETVVLSNICMDNPSTGSSFGAGAYVLHHAVASGTRISGRIQCSTGSSTMGVAVTITAAGAAPGITTYTNYGSNTGTSGATSVDPGGTINTKGAYSQMTASTSAVTQELMSMYTAGGNTAARTAAWAVDIATGAGGAEVVLVPDLRLAGRDVPNATATVALMPRSHSVLTYIAASTRIAARASCTINDATDRLFSMAILSGTAPAESGGGVWAYA